MAWKRSGAVFAQDPTASPVLKTEPMLLLEQFFELLLQGLVFLAERFLFGLQFLHEIFFFGLDRFKLGLELSLEFLGLFLKANFQLGLRFLELIELNRA